MGYLYLTMALIAGISKGYLGKTVSRDMTSFKGCAFMNLWRMLFCAATGLVLILARGGPGALAISSEGITVYIIAGIGMSAFCVCWMYAYRTEAYIFLNVFTMIGTVVTCILDAAVYQTKLGITEVLGILLLIAAVYIMSVYNKEVKGKLTFKGISILVIGCLGSAVSDFCQKMYVKRVGGSSDIFNFYMYVFAALLVGLLLMLSSAQPKAQKLPKKLSDKKHMIIYFGIAFFLYLNSLSKTSAAAIMPSARIYPVLQGANLILSALMAHFIWKEKINLKSVCGMITAFVGLMILNLL